eukprot:GEZU01023550.1.p2 GENE.GEZU01023550.1~~GEZU01023550.1.p2  ORF type:complete len:109 (+),score=12.86 GEZU01023550.1:921-1247(+)
MDGWTDIIENSYNKIGGGGPARGSSSSSVVVDVVVFVAPAFFCFCFKLDCREHLALPEPSLALLDLLLDDEGNDGERKQNKLVYQQQHQWHRGMDVAGGIGRARLSTS